MSTPMTGFNLIQLLSRAGIPLPPNTVSAKVELEVDSMAILQISIALTPDDLAAIGRALTTPQCDCDQPSNPDVRAHASDCTWAAEELAREWAVAGKLTPLAGASEPKASRLPVHLVYFMGPT